MATTGQEPLTGPLEADDDALSPSISVVIPVYNEGSSLRELYERTVKTLDATGRGFELIFVDDGSVDTTFAELERMHAADDRVRVVRFKRNFGQHAAMHAGLVRARGRDPRDDGRRPPERSPRTSRV